MHRIYSYILKSKKIADLDRYRKDREVKYSKKKKSRASYVKKIKKSQRKSKITKIITKKIMQEI